MSEWCVAESDSDSDSDSFNVHYQLFPHGTCLNIDYTKHELLCSRFFSFLFSRHFFDFAQCCLCTASTVLTPGYHELDPHPALPLSSQWHSLSAVWLQHSESLSGYYSEHKELFSFTDNAFGTKELHTRVYAPLALEHGGNMFRRAPTIGKAL